MSVNVADSYRVEHIDGRWACVVAGAIALMFDTETQAREHMKHLIAASIKQRQLDRARGFIE